MSAAEVIEMIKKLPPQEQGEVEAYVRAMDIPAPERKIRYMPTADATRIAEGIFERHSELFRKLAE